MNRKVVETKCGFGKMYEFVGRNRLGEKIVVQIRRAKVDVGVGRDDHPKYWLSVTTLVTDTRGVTQEKYNPQVTAVDGMRLVNKKWFLTPSAENVQRLLEQVERLAFGGQ